MTPEDLTTSPEPAGFTAAPSSDRSVSAHATTLAAPSAGKRTRSEQLTAAPSSPTDRAAESLFQADRALYLVEVQVTRLAAALEAVDHAGARSAADAIRALEPGIAGALGEARRAGADAHQLAALKDRHAHLTWRLEPLMARAPRASLGLAFELGNPGADDSEAAAWSSSLAQSEPSAHSLPPGVDYRAVPGTLHVIVRKAWLLSALAAPVGRSVVTPARLRELLVHLRTTGALAWADDAAIHRAAEHVAISSLPRGAFVELELPSELFRYLGLPPSVGSMVDRDGDGLLVVLPLAAALAASGQRAPLPLAQRRKVLAAAEDFLGVPAMQPGRDQFLHTADVHCLVQGATASLRLSRADLSWLFGEAMIEEVMKLGEDDQLGAGPRMTAAKPSSASRTNGAPEGA